MGLRSSVRSIFSFCCVLFAVGDKLLSGGQRKVLSVCFYCMDELGFILFLKSFVEECF